MTITAKEIAKQLNISESAVSLALNQKPGVSTKTRKKVIEVAKSLGYDFSKINPHTNKAGVINFILYTKSLLFDTPFFRELITGVEKGFKNTGYRVIINHLHSEEYVQEQLDEIINSDCDGIILLGTEMAKEDFASFSLVNLPIILLDSYFDSNKMDCILINNFEGAYNATNYLIKKIHAQPGHLKASLSIYNFDERADGYYKAIRQNGMSVAKSIVHSLSPSIDGAFADMLSIIEQGDELATCYFADNDEIAIGAMKAFKEKGFNIPSDIAIIGFDNIPFSTYVEPPLTTINVPKTYLGELAAKRMLSVIENSSEYQPIRIEVKTNLIPRKST
ncbi:LacI family transcriptional regulator [Clostridium zeae]|uniref:LacI family transcriptional regulator n=1 Tax=Clostridium zeae TaxID=2759022 RepID=A0ABQ1EBF3_9CLOT|nr:LacI family DNA-binding transcriptional regulator [Clostridium zeae]GFZ32127.1 LacI family transcriptional regulator [Clostridium zeae]